MQAPAWRARSARLRASSGRARGSTGLMRFLAAAGGLCSIVRVRSDASASNGGISAASGRLRQYLLGISARSAAGLARAGLKIAR